MRRKVTIHEVAERAGVSTATVSFVFTRPDKVKPHTRERVMAAADELGYVPSANARGLATGRTGAIGLYSYDYLLEPGREVPDSEQPGTLFPLYADEVQRGVQLECRTRGLALMLGGNRTPDHLPQVIEVAGRVDGLIAFAGALSEADLRQVASRIPVVELGGEVRAPGSHTVLVDNRDSMGDLARHLLERHGFRRFAYFGDTTMPEFRARWEGFCEALRRAGAPIPEITRTVPVDDGSTQAAVRGLLAEGRPEVIVCDTDQAAIVVIETLSRLGIRVPDDIAVTGFDGILAGRLVEPHLTTVRQPMEQIGRTAVRILEKALTTDVAVDEHESLPSVLVVGRSCGC